MAGSAGPASVVPVPAAAVASAGPVAGLAVRVAAPGAASVALGADPVGHLAEVPAAALAIGRGAGSVTSPVAARAGARRAPAVAGARTSQAAEGA